MMRVCRGTWGLLFALLVALGGPGNGLAAESVALDQAAVRAAYKQRNYAEVLRMVRPHAERGDAFAQNVLGILYQNGEGVPQDYVQSLAWFLKAAQQGYASAQYSVARQYNKGLGTKEDPAQAFYWFREAANRGHLDSQVNVGVAFSTGQGVAADRDQAMLWWRRAADAGQVLAQGNLGSHLGSRARTPNEFIDSYVYLSLAAAKGDSEASENRRKLMALMTKAQIEEGDRRVAAWKPARAWRAVPEAPTAGARRAEPSSSPDSPRGTVRSAPGPDSVPPPREPRMSREQILSIITESFVQ